jgi:hypothetical protein
MRSDPDEMIAPKPWRLWIALPFIAAALGAGAGLGFGLSQGWSGHALMTPVLLAAIAGAALGMIPKRPS